MFMRFIPLFFLVGLSCTTTTISPVSYVTNTDTLTRTLKTTPTIAQFSPDTVWTFKTLTIRGTNFGYDAQGIRVLFDTARAIVTDAEDTVVTVTVPEGARTGLIHVWAYEQTATSIKPVVVQYTFNPHSVNDTISDGGSISIPGTGMDHARGHLRLYVGGNIFPIDSVLPDRIVFYVPSNCAAGALTLSDSIGTYNCGSLTMTRYSRWGTLSAIWNRITVKETHHRTGYTKGPAHTIDSTWTVNGYLDSQHDWDVRGNKFVRTTRGLTYNSPPLTITWDTLGQDAYVTFRYSSSTSTQTHTFDTIWYGQSGNYLPAPLPVDGEYEFVLPLSYIQYSIQESFTDGQGLVSWQEQTTTTQPTSGEFDIILKH